MKAKSVGAGSRYAVAAEDSQGSWLEGGTTYKLTLPPKIPYRDFWSVTVYDTQTRSLLQTDYPYSAIGAGAGLPKEGTNSGPVKQNADGSTDIYFDPQAPEGEKSD
jgi:hypothetical protein